MRIIAKIKKRIAFTLAEVLIVLGVVGIIAQVTIPTLVQNISNATYYSQFMNTYSLLTQASNSMINDNGGTIAGQFSNTTDLMNLFATKLKPVKLCNEGSATSCWKDTYILQLGRVNTITLGVNDAAMILANGASIRFSTIGGDFSSTCQALNNTYVKNGVTYTACDIMWVDVNGQKSPNELGRDLFMFILYPTFPIVPDGVAGTEDYVSSGGYDAGCDPPSYWGGMTCGAKLLNDGKMNY